MGEPSDDAVPRTAVSGGNKIKLFHQNAANPIAFSSEADAASREEHVKRQSGVSLLIQSGQKMVWSLFQLR
jgi:hypothetical protein